MPTVATKDPNLRAGTRVDALVGVNFVPPREIPIYDLLLKLACQRIKNWMDRSLKRIWYLTWVLNIHFSLKGVFL